MERAACQPAFNVDRGNELITTDEVVRRFGSVEYLHPEDAALLAARRAADLQMELGLDNHQPKKEEINAISTARVPQPQEKITTASGLARKPLLADEVIISTYNPRTGRIPRSEGEDADQPPRLWGKEVLPLDFSLLNFSDLEEGTRQLVNVDDNWLYQDEVDPVLGPTSSELSERQKKLETWRNANQPLVADGIAPFLRSIVLTEPYVSVPFPESFKHALGCLAEGGSVQEQHLSEHALELWIIHNLERAGRDVATAVTFGVKVKCIDYTAQNISFGDLHFAAVDMGGDLPLTMRLRQSLGPEDNQEANQCVIKHLALALDWWPNGRKFRIPPRSSVEIMASELRAIEYVQAQMCLEQIGNANTVLEHEIWSAARDAMNLGRDRSFERLGWLLKGSCPPEMEFNLRIYDYEESMGLQKVTVYQSDNGLHHSMPNESLNFVAINTHIRFLLPPRETFPGS